MGCNCNKPKPAGGGKPKVFILANTNGATQEFGSRLEAEAARKRAGGGTITPVTQRI